MAEERKRVLVCGEMPPPWVMEKIAKILLKRQEEERLERQAAGLPPLPSGSKMHIDLIHLPRGPSEDQLAEGKEGPSVPVQK